MAQKVIFILGGGPRIGHSVAQKFLHQGYKVAIGRRNVQDTADSTGLDGVVSVYLDVTKPESVEAAFREVESKLGIPNVVVYNGKPHLCEGWCARSQILHCHRSQSL